ncbi:hypothetical protein LZG04_26405 [Saccharothrix sp. S26]|uniref:hypothetical protein n=1 Tax=Saccharothrix sp. S26 TaxID=2907215 RepID=UPI001F3D3FE7|nr:hypothetical protein [Saccharothrix sp. S26]MCE6998303.1 hypothetical protein [Saccharothrix sp. S26]
MRRVLATAAATGMTALALVAGLDVAQSEPWHQDHRAAGADARGNPLDDWDHPHPDPLDDWDHPHPDPLDDWDHPHPDPLDNWDHPHPFD